MSEAITSKRNPRLRELKRLRERKHRREQGLFVAEGEDLVGEALRRGATPETVFSVRGAGLPFVLPQGVEHVEATAEALSAVSSLGSGSRVIGVFHLQWPDRTGATSRPQTYRRTGDCRPLTILR